MVGYGTQKKVNLSGAVSSIAVDKITEGRPINNISNALAGMAAGVQVMSSGNQPGEDNAYIRVRGQGTLNSAAPLVLIDGVEASINSVNPPGCCHYLSIERCCFCCYLWITCCKWGHLNNHKTKVKQVA